MASPPSARPGASKASSVSGAASQVAVTDYAGCPAAADAPPQEIIDLAASLKNNWQLIYAYVYNSIDTEPTGESTKGALGTYLDGSGNSFDQSTLLVLLLRAAGYQANFVVGTTTFTAAKLGLSSLPQQLILDAGGSTDGTTPYAWVQVYVSNTWTTLDPAGKSYTILPGTNLTQWMPSTPPTASQYSPSVLDGILNGIQGAYTSSPSPIYNSITAFVGGRRIVYSSTPATGTRSGGAVYSALPTSYRTGYSLASASVTPVYICTDQTYGHVLSFSGGRSYIDGQPSQGYFTDPINITVWHPNPGGTAWGQAAAENLGGYSAVLSFAAGRVSQSRAQHDSSIVNALASADPAMGTNAALLAAASSELSQTSQEIGLLDQLAGTYTVSHHMLQLVRSNNTIDTPLTSTSIDQVTSSPGSGLSVSPAAVSYALSAVQSAQEAVALGQSGAAQPISAASLLGNATDSSGRMDASGVVFVKSSAAIPANYSSSQQSILSSFQSAGYDLVVPYTAPAASSPLGFVAMNGAGASQFILSTASGIYKGAADLNPADALGSIGAGGKAAESGPPGLGLNVNSANGEVTFEEPLISIGSTAPYKLEFDLLYSSRPDAQVTASAQLPAGRPDSPGFAHNYEIRATASSDGFPMLGSGLTGPALPGVAAAWDLLINSNVIAQYYAGTSVPNYSPWANVYANAVIGEWLIAASTNNVVTVTRGLSSENFYKLPWAAYVTAQPSGDQLTQAGGAFSLRTAQGTVLAFNSTDGQAAAITTPAGVQTLFTYTPVTVGLPGPSQTTFNELTKVAVGTHSLTFAYTTQSNTLTQLLKSVTDETGRVASLTYGNCNDKVTVTTPIPQLCSGRKPDYVSPAPDPLIFNYSQPQAGVSGQAVLLGDVTSVNVVQGGYLNTSIAYDGARMMPISLTNANSHTTSYFISPSRSEVDDALGHASYSVTYPLVYFGDYIVTDSYDPLGNKTETQYNYAGQLVDKILPDTVYGYQYSYTYDPHGNLASTAIGPTANNQQILTSTVWDQTWNKPHLVTNALSNVTTYTYTSHGLLYQVVSPAVPYQGNQVQPTSTYAYYPNGQLKTVTAPDAEVTTYTYDSTFNLQSVIVDSGASPHFNMATTLGYDTSNVGNVTSVQTPRGYTTSFQYDLARRQTKKITPPIAADGNVQHTTTYSYDLFGQLTQTSQDATSTSPYTELVSKMTYDPVGHVLSRTVPTTGSTDHTTIYTYDTDERLSTTTVPISSSTSDVTTQTYDADSRPFQVLINGNLKETHTYNGDGLPYQVADGAATLNSAGQPTGTAHITTYTYDNYDRLQQTTYADGTYELLTLDHSGQVLTDLNREGLKTTLLYDNDGRVTSETDQSFSAPFTMTYDQVGRLLTKTYSAGTFTYSYDTAGRQKQTIRPDNLTIGYGYDSDGNMSSIIYPDTYVYDYAFDELDRMKSVGELAPGSTTTTYFAEYTYSPLSLRQTATYQNGTSTAYGYDAFDGLNSITQTFNAASSIPSATYAYNLDYQERRVGDSVSVASLLWHPSVAGTRNYQLNGSGLNQYGTINGQSLSYDSNGNLIGDASAPLGTATYQFDQKNRLTSASNSQHTANYAYDPFSRRASKTVDGTSTVFVDDASRTLADYNSSGSEIQHYVYGADSAPVVVEVFNGAATPTSYSYLYMDKLGSAVLQAGPGGKIGQTSGYSPWGESSNTMNTPYRFAGMRLDAETQLYYDNARYYSPAQGRFLSPDPIGAKGGINIYAYVGNDPLDATDPTGLVKPLFSAICGGDGPSCLPPRTIFPGGSGGGDYGSDTSDDGGIGSLFDDSDGGIGTNETVYTVSQGGVNLATVYVPDNNSGDVVFAGAAPTAGQGLSYQIAGSPAAYTPNVALPNGFPVLDKNSPSGLLQSPNPNLSNVVEAGVANAGDDPFSAAFYANQNVGQNGYFDYQREQNPGGAPTPLPQYRDVSNFNVGLYAYSAGWTLGQTLGIANAFGSVFSHNYSNTASWSQTLSWISTGYGNGPLFNNGVR